MAGRSGGAGSDGGSGTDGGNPDPNCTTANARTGAACTRDCLIGCGFNGIGTKTCTCVSGAYSECPCPRPAGYMGAATAPYCATPDGTTTALKNMPCATEWDQCIGKDVVTGTTPQGCACLRDPASTMLLWACGSTNKWFALSDGGM
jgi:hypothetical protein